MAFASSGNFFTYTDTNIVNAMFQLSIEEMSWQFLGSRRKEGMLPDLDGMVILNSSGSGLAAK